MANARDSVRLNSVADIMHALQTAYASKQAYPLPDSPVVTLLYNGTTIGYQGCAGTNVLAYGKINGNGTDPLDGSCYTYNTNFNKNYAEDMGFLESASNYAFSRNVIDQAYAANYSTRYPFVRGDALGIFIANNTGSTDNTPLQFNQTGTTLDI